MRMLDKRDWQDRAECRVCTKLLLFTIPKILFELIFESDTGDSEIMEFVHAISKIFVPHYVDFVICYLAVPRLTLVHSRRCSLTNQTLITAFIYFDPKVRGSFITRLGHKVEHLVGFEPGTFQF